MSGGVSSPASIIRVRMTDPVDYELPDSYILTYLELNGTPINKLPHPVIPTDDDLLLIEIKPIHPGPVTESSSSPCRSFGR